MTRCISHAMALGALLVSLAGCLDIGVIGTGLVASAGVDQNVLAGNVVTLDGSKSENLDGGTLAYAWAQTEGPTVSLSDPTSVQPTFTAPEVTSVTDLVFQILVSDGTEQQLDSVAIIVNPVNLNNNPPVASCSLASSVASGAAVMLDGSGSTDPDGDQIAFAWTQTVGPTVTLSSASAAKPTFSAPTVGGNTTLTFELKVSDLQQAQDTASCSTTVQPSSGNRAPVAAAGTSKTVTGGASVTLDGSASQDPDGDAITYQWTQTAGPSVTLSSSSSPTPSFTAPTSSSTVTLTFSLVVTDSHGLASTPSTVTITVTSGSVPTVVFTKAISLHAVTRTGIVLFFMTDVGVAGTVGYGVGSPTQNSITESNAVTRHVVSLTGLTPDTHYQYKVDAGTASVSGDFWTAIDYQASPKAFSFAVVGDARVHSEWNTVANAIVAKAPRFMVQTGDNNNSSGSAANWEDYYNSAPNLFRSIPVFAAQGNHDTGSNYTMYNIAPQSSSGSDLYYAFVWGNVGFVTINSNSTNSTQTSWVSSALTAMSGGPLFTMHHHPLYSCGSHGSSSSMQNTYQSLFEGSGVTVDFTGHDHDLIVWSTINSVRYVVSGGGGTGLYSLSGCSGPYSSKQYGFAIIDVNGASITETLYDDNGSEVYTESFNAQGASVDFSNLGNLVVY